jgi:hypothetical protein
LASARTAFVPVLLQVHLPEEGSRAATIGCANLWMKQGHDDDYIPALLTSSNSG